MNSFADDVINGKLDLIKNANKLEKLNALKNKVLKTLTDRDSKNSISSTSIVSKIKESKSDVEEVLCILYSERKVGHCKVIKDGVEDNVWFSVGIVPKKYSHKKVDKNTKVNTPDIDGDENVEETIE